MSAHPDWFVIENVEGIEEGGEEDSSALEHMVVVVHNAGYGTHPYKLYDQEYVLPQGRERVFMIGFRRPATQMPVESYDQLLIDNTNLLRDMQHTPLDIGDVLLPPIHNQVTHVVQSNKDNDVGATWGSNIPNIQRRA